MKVHSFSCGELGIFPRRQIEDAQPCLIFHREEFLAGVGSENGGESGRQKNRIE